MSLRVVFRHTHWLSQLLLDKFWGSQNLIDSFINVADRTDLIVVQVRVVRDGTFCFAQQGNIFIFIFRTWYHSALNFSPWYWFNVARRMLWTTTDSRGPIPLYKRWRTRLKTVCVIEMLGLSSWKHDRLKTKARVLNNFCLEGTLINCRELFLISSLPPGNFLNQIIVPLGPSR